MSWWTKTLWDGCRVANNYELPAARARSEALPDSFGWYRWVTPSTQQYAPCCGGEAWATWFSLMLRRYSSSACIPRYHHIDGMPIWERGREMYYFGNLAGGMYLWEAFDAAVDLGVLPPGTKARYVIPMREDICAELRNTPLVQAQKVAPGWLNPNPDNGGVDETKPPVPGCGYHASVMIANTVKKDRLFYAEQLQWGPLYGWNGCSVMSEDYWEKCYGGDMLMTADLPEGWKDWDGWRKYLKRVDE